MTLVRPARQREAQLPWTGAGAQIQQSANDRHGAQRVNNGLP